METSDRKKEILAAAEKVFDASGYAATTVEAVAVEAGLSKGSIYNYFRSKQDLFSQVFAGAVSGEQTDIGRLMSGPLGPEEKLSQLLNHWSGRMEYYKRIGRLVLEFWAAAARQERQGELAVTFQQMYAGWRQLIGDILIEGIRSGQFRREIDPSIAASLIMAVMDGIVVQSILDVGIEVDEDFLAAMKRAIIMAITAGKNPQEGSEQ